MAIIAGFLVIFYLYVVHCNWVTSNAYSSPSVILQARNGDGRYGVKLIKVESTPLVFT